MNALAVHVSKHALERYRRHIFDAADTEIVRRLNSASILKAAKLGAASVLLPCGQKVVLKGYCVVTITPKSKHKRRVR
jgi:hypothetical protein